MKVNELRCQVTGTVRVVRINRWRWWPTVLLEVEDKFVTLKAGDRTDVTLTGERRG
jgi:hypothetical protein